MADLKQHISKHIKSAQAWLVRAEEDFGKDDNIRGELNLILAQAELQRLKETKAKSGRSTSLYVRHGLALAAALSVIGFSFLGTYLFVNKQQKAVPIPLTKQEASVAYEKVSQVTSQPVNHVEIVVQKTLPQTTNPVPQKVSVQPVAAVNPKNNDSGLAEKEIELSPREMQNLIRVAGKSLRGQ